MATACTIKAGLIDVALSSSTVRSSHRVAKVQKQMDGPDKLDGEYKKRRLRLEDRDRRKPSQIGN